MCSITYLKTYFSFLILFCCASFKRFSISPYLKSKSMRHVAICFIICIRIWLFSKRYIGKVSKYHCVKLCLVIIESGHYWHFLLKLSKTSWHISPCNIDFQSHIWTRTYLCTKLNSTYDVYICMIYELVKIQFGTKTGPQLNFDLFILKRSSKLHFLGAFIFKNLFFKADAQNLWK